MGDAFKMFTSLFNIFSSTNGFSALAQFVPRTMLDSITGYGKWTGMTAIGFPKPCQKDPNGLGECMYHKGDVDAIVGEDNWADLAPLVFEQKRWRLGGGGGPSQD